MTQMTRMEDNASAVFLEEQMDDRLKKIDFKMEGGQESLASIKVLFDTPSEEFAL